MKNIHKDTVSIKSYDEMAKYYENYVDTKPWNAYKGEAPVDPNKYFGA